MEIICKVGKNTLHCGPKETKKLKFSQIEPKVYGSLVGNSIWVLLICIGCHVNSRAEGKIEDNENTLIFHVKWALMVMCCVVPIIVMIFPIHQMIIIHRELVEHERLQLNIVEDEQPFLFSPI